jgi:hypothetical protein
MHAKTRHVASLLARATSIVPPVCRTMAASTTHSRLKGALCDSFSPPTNSPVNTAYPQQLSPLGAASHRAVTCDTPCEHLCNDYVAGTYVPNAATAFDKSKEEKVSREKEERKTQAVSSLSCQSVGYRYQPSNIFSRHVFSPLQQSAR